MTKHAFLLAACLLVVSMPVQALAMDNIGAERDINGPAVQQTENKRSEMLNRMIERLKNQEMAPDKPHQYVIADGQGHIISLVNARYITVKAEGPETRFKDIVNTDNNLNNDDDIVDLPPNSIRIGTR